MKLVPSQRKVKVKSALHLRVTGALELILISIALSNYFVGEELLLDVIPVCRRKESCNKHMYLKKENNN